MKTMKMYRVFNELHATKEKALEVLVGWEHKERVTEVFAVAEELNSFINLELDNVYMAKTLEEALAECE